MKRLALVLVLCFSTFAIADSAAPSPTSSVSVDAGVAPVAAPSQPAAPAATTFPDPHADPAGFVSSVLTFGETNWPLGVGLGLFGLLELIIWLGASVPKLQALGKGRTTLVLGGAAAVLSAGLHAVLGGGSTQTALFAAIVAAAAFWHPAAADVARATARNVATAVNVAVVCIISVVVASCLSSSQVKSGAGALAACAVADVTKYGAEVESDLAKADFDAALSQLKTASNLTQDALNCIVQTVLAVLTAQQTSSLAGELSPVVVNGRAYLAAHGAAQ